MASRFGTRASLITDSFTLEKSVCLFVWVVVMKS